MPIKSALSLVQRLRPSKNAWVCFFLAICAIVGLLCVLAGVFLTVALLQGTDVSLVWWGLVLLPTGVLVIQFVSTTEIRPETTGGNSNDSQIVNSATLRGLTAIKGLVLHVIVILLFAGLLDGGLRLQACVYSCLGYWAGALLILVRRAKALTRVDLLYLTWAWLPMIVIGVPLFMRIWKAKGLL